MIIDRGILVSYDSTAHTATVQLMGSMSRLISAVPVAHSIGPELLAAGTDCIIGFVGEGSQAIVLTTFDGAPPAWITSALIKDGEIASADIADGTIATADVGDGQITPAKLSFSPPTFEHGYSASSTNQTVTNTWTQFQSVQVTVTPTGGNSLNVLVVLNVDLETTAFTSWNIGTTRVYRDTDGKGETSRIRMNANNERATIMAHYADHISAAHTYKLYVYKAVDRNTIVANNGAISVIWSADTV